MKRFGTLYYDDEGIMYIDLPGMPGAEKQPMPGLYRLGGLRFEIIEETWWPTGITQHEENSGGDRGQDHIPHQ